MNLEQLEYIVETAKTGSLTKAAQNCNVTLSAVSQAVSSLEAEFGFSLFTRSRLGAVPTAEGQRILQKAYAILEQFQELKSEAEGYSSLLSGSLRIATVPVPLTLSIDAIIQFKKHFPHIQLEITEKATLDIIEDIKQNHADIGLIFVDDSTIHQHRGLHFGKLLESKFVVGVSRQSPLAMRQSITPEELRKYPLVLYKDDSLFKLMDVFEEQYGEMDLLFSTNQTRVIQKVVEENVAVTVGVDLSFSSFTPIPSGNIVTLELEMPPGHAASSFGWVQPGTHHLSKPASIFLDKLKHQIG
ncbi:LysR family transcriptional regulator [Paenibacillus sp. NPDC093718]|uniref:LysR family transcriptional regulator n=1 Tax=Paenibacillus sp. NPDC093718 TaxID=3390601 RepID=UPI003D03F55A